MFLTLLGAQTHGILQRSLAARDDYDTHEIFMWPTPGFP